MQANIEAVDLLIWEIIFNGLVVLARAPVQQEGENQPPVAAIAAATQLEES